MEITHEKTGYELSRAWFDFCFDNPEKIAPIHTALYFFCIEHCNRLGWKDKFGLPTQMAMEAIGVKNWRTYSNALNDLIEWRFIKLIEKCKNQYSATVIAIAFAAVKNTKALTKAIQKHGQKQVSSIVVIDKPYNQELYNKKITRENYFEILDEDTRASINEGCKVSIDANVAFMYSKGEPYAENVIRGVMQEVPMVSLRLTVESIWEWLDKFETKIRGDGIEEETPREFQKWFSNWLKSKLKETQPADTVKIINGKLPSGENNCSIPR